MPSQRQIRQMPGAWATRGLLTGACSRSRWAGVGNISAMVMVCESGSKRFGYNGWRLAGVGLAHEGRQGGKFSARPDTSRGSDCFGSWKTACSKPRYRCQPCSHVWYATCKARMFFEIAGGTSTVVSSYSGKQKMKRCVWRRLRNACSVRSVLRRRMRFSDDGRSGSGC